MRAEAATMPTVTVGGSGNDSGNNSNSNGNNDNNARNSNSNSGGGSGSRVCGSRDSFFSLKNATDFIEKKNQTKTKNKKK